MFIIQFLFQQVYIIKAEREKQTDPSYVLRSYREFYEFDQKLRATFPLATHSSLSRDIQFGRSNIRQVADRRKVMIEQMLKSLFSMAHEIAHVCKWLSLLIFVFK